MTSRSILLALPLVALVVGGCGEDDKPYKPKPAYSGEKPALPPVPTLPNKPKKVGDAYTVYGATHDLRSDVHKADFKGKQTSIVGYVVKTNWDVACKDENKPADGEICVPKCSIHKTGKEDPPECDVPIPMYWIADDKGEKDFKRNAIPVVGFASNFAKMYDTIKEGEGAEVQDLSGFVPDKLAAIGGKIKVTGSYGFSANPGSSGVVSNPRNGVILHRKQEWLEEPPEPATLPGM